MLTTIALVLLVLWAAGLIGGVALGGVIHVLLVIALVLIVLRLFSGHRPV